MTIQGLRKWSSWCRGVKWTCCGVKWTKSGQCTPRAVVGVWTLWSGRKRTPGSLRSPGGSLRSSGGGRANI